MKKIIKFVVLGLVLLILAGGVFSSFVIVPAGFRGVVLRWGAVQDEVMGEGLHFILPIMESVKKMEVRTVKYEVSAVAYSRDIQTVDAIVALNYHLSVERVNKLYQLIGSDYRSRVIDPSIQESVKAATAKFTAQELIEERPKVKDEIREQLLSRFDSKGIVVDDFSIVNFDFSDEYEKAVEAKQVAQQSALKAENDLKRIETEAKQRVEQAKAEAEAIKIQAEAITQQGGKDYVQLKAVEKWDGKLPQQFVPGSALPFLNLTK